MVLYIQKFSGIATPRYTPGPQERPLNGGGCDFIRPHDTKPSIQDLPTPIRPSAPRRRIVVALYNYKAKEQTDVSFRKGDRMEVLDDDESDWWRVLHLGTRQEGLIPWNFVAEELSIASEE